MGNARLVFFVKSRPAAPASIFNEEMFYKEKRDARRSGSPMMEGEPEPAPKKKKTRPKKKKKQRRKTK